MIGVPGRPRSEQATAAVLAAALELVHRYGYPDVTVKAIAEEAGVGRQTVYRWWPTKAEVVLEAVVERAARLAMPTPTGQAVADVRATLHATFSQRIAGPAITGLMAESTHDPVFAEKFRGQLLAPRRQVVRDLLLAGQADGQLGHGYDVDLAVDIVFGVMWYRVLSGHADVDRKLADQLTDTLARLLGTGPGDNR